MSLDKLKTIINGCREGDHKYQKMLYDTYRAFGLKTVFRYIYTYEDALEITNDGFVKFFLQIDKFKCENDVDLERFLMGWLKRIMINTSIDLLRKKMLLPEIGGMAEEIWDMKERSASPEQMVIYKDLILLIKKLPPPYRIVFNMHVIDGYTHTEIAENLKIPVGTSKSNLLRARALMQNYLQQNEKLAACSI